MSDVLMSSPASKNCVTLWVYGVEGDRLEEGVGSTSYGKRGTIFNMSRVE
jgi:hypothetical protein